MNATDRAMVLVLALVLAIPAVVTMAGPRLPAPLIPRPPPDLVPSITVSAGMPVANGATMKVPVGVKVLKVQVRVKNSGGTGAAAGHTTLVRLFRNGAAVVTDTRSEPALPPGGVTTHAYTVAMLGGGTFQVEATADSSAVVHEGNESNTTAKHSCSVLHMSLP